VTLTEADPDTDYAASVTERYGDETQVSAFDGVMTRSPRWTRWYLSPGARAADGAAYEGTLLPKRSRKVETGEAMMVSTTTRWCFPKSWGLFYLIASSLCRCLRSAPNRKRFDRAKHSILDRDDKPWR
jgi:cytochrome c oxidase cbb3-type subunit 4